MANIPKKCKAMRGDEVYEFDSRTDAAIWLLDCGLTTLKIDTIAKKISAAIKAQEPLLGYVWQHISQEEAQPLERGHNMNNWIKPHEPIAHRAAPLTAPEEEPYDLGELNAAIEAQRQEAFETSMGIKALINKILPSRITEYDVRRERGTIVAEYPIVVATEEGMRGFNDWGEVATFLHINLSRADLESALEGAIGSRVVQLSINAANELRKLLDN